VNEHIGSAVFRRNEAESFVSVEKLYSASGHVSPVASAGISCDAHPKVLNRQPQPSRASARGRGEANSGRRTCDRREPKSVLQIAGSAYGDNARATIASPRPWPDQRHRFQAAC
jgi:hypothetical protein